MIVHEDVVACGLDLPVKRRLESEAVEAPRPGVPVRIRLHDRQRRVEPATPGEAVHGARVIPVAAARRGTREPPNRWERAFATGAHRTLFCGL